MGSCHGAAQLVELSGQLGELRYTRIELDHLVERPRGIPEAVPLNGDPRRVDAPIDSPPPGALLEPAVALCRHQRRLDGRSGYDR